MATITITVDTEQETLDVQVGGSKLENVTNVWINKYKSYFDVEVGQEEEMEGLKKSTRLHASVNDKDWSQADDMKSLASLLLPSKNN